MRGDDTPPPDKSHALLHSYHGGQTDPLHADWLMPAPTITACAPRTPPRLAAQELCATVSSLYVPSQQPLLTDNVDGLRGGMTRMYFNSVKFFSTTVLPGAQTVPPVVLNLE